MHLVISGPYEVLYTTAVDIWSFGCLLLNMLVGKNGPLKQRGVSVYIIGLISLVTEFVLSKIILVSACRKLHYYFLHKNSHTLKSFIIKSLR